MRIGIVMKRTEVNGIPFLGNNLMYFMYFNRLDPDYEVVGVSPFERRSLSDVCDVIVLPGGRDVINEDGWLSSPADSHYEAFENYHKEEIMRMPCIGICRGFQAYLYKFLGLPLNDKLWGHKQSTVGRGELIHSITCYGGFQVRPGIVKSLKVNSIHNQGFIASESGSVLQNADSWMVSEDGVLEGIQIGKFLGFQFHPEEMVVSNVDVFIKSFIQRTC